MTIEEIKAKIASAKATRENLIAQVNAHNGYIEAYEEMLRTMEEAAPIAAPELTKVKAEAK